MTVTHELVLYLRAEIVSLVDKIRLLALFLYSKIKRISPLNAPHKYNARYAVVHFSLKLPQKTVYVVLTFVA